MSDTRRIQLDVTGMTCRMCSGHIERKLNKLADVKAKVDFPTRIATVDAPSTISVEALCEAVAAAGYQAELRPEGAPIVEPPAGSMIGSMAARFLRWPRRAPASDGISRQRQSVQP